MASALPSFASTKETTNYARLCRLLVDVGSQALRDTFDSIHPPAGLHHVLARHPEHATLQSLHTGRRRVINPTQWGKLYPTISSSVSSASFDITLLMILLRNICGLHPPATGWDNLPPPADTSKEANIARVKYYRNTVYGHASQASVDDTTFNTYWQDISTALVALGGASYGAAINKLKTECMDPDTEEHYRELLKQWKKDEDSIKHKLVEIEDNIGNDIEQLKEKLDTFMAAKEGSSSKDKDETRDDLKQMKSEIQSISEKLNTQMSQREETTDEENTRSNLEQIKVKIGNINEKLETLMKQLPPGKEKPRIEENSRSNLEQMKVEIRNMNEKLETLMEQQPHVKEKPRSEDNIRNDIEQLSKKLDTIMAQRGGASSKDKDETKDDLKQIKREIQSISEKLSSQEMKDEVPSEVRTRGPAAVQVYNNALTEGKTLVKRLPLMFIGQAEAGKTSLKDSLNGICFNSEKGSTVGIDVDPSHFKLTNQIWKPGEKDQEANAEMAISFEHQAARFMADRLKEKGKDSEKKRAHVTSEKSYDSVNFEPAIALIPEAPLSEPSKGLDQIQTFENSFEPTPASEDTAGPTPDDVTTSAPPEQEFEEIAALAETLLQDGGLENGDVYSMLWDFAGQSVYYVTHVLFLTWRAIYFLVYDLSQNPHDRAKPPVKQGVYKKFADTSNLKTNLDYLDFWMTSVASLASQGEDDIGPKSELLPKKLPAVFLVCTHADKPHGGRDPREMADEIFGFLKKKSYGAHLYDVFCVDNTKSGSESECPEVMRLREEVLAVSNGLPYLNEAIPIKWLKYEKALRMMLESGYKWISFGKAKYVASKVCKIDNDNEVLTLLNFLHDLRILVHFDDIPELNQLVILDPQWLIDVFKKVITVRPRHQWKEKKFEDLWCKLEGEGILVEDLVKHVWSDLSNEKQTIEGLIAIMEKFGLLCCCPSSDDLCSKQYLVPSMLKSHPPDAIMKLAASAQVPSLFVKFESGQVPAGLFPLLVLQFYQWGKEEFWRPGNPKLYQNFARFFIHGDKGCSVILRCHLSSIEIIYHSIGDDTACSTFTHVIRRQIGLILECMRNQLCRLNNMKYQMSIICSVCCEGNAVIHCEMHDEQSCKQEECLHFWSESELCGSKQTIICTKSAFAKDITVDTKVWEPWFTSSAEQAANGRFIGRLLTSYEENVLALLGGHQVLESILAEACDPKDIVSRLTDNLEQLALAEPNPNTKKLVRCLAMEAKCSNRLDVVKHLRDITPAGTTGPLLPENLAIQRIPFEQGRKLTISLSGGDEWKFVADKLGLTSDEIRFLDKRTLNPAEAMLHHIANLRPTTVGNLYDVLIECELPVLADKL